MVERSIEFFMDYYIPALAVVAAGALAFGLLFVIQVVIKHKTYPREIGLSVIFIAGILVQGYPVFQFEKRVRESLENSPWLRVVSETKLIDVTWPVTWFFPPIERFEIVGLDPNTETTFYKFIVRYAAPDIDLVVDVDCKNRVFYITNSASDGSANGPSESVELDEQEFELFCESDWNEERIALEEFLATQ